MIMNEMEGRIRGHGRSRNIQYSQGEPSRRDEISRDPLPMDTLQSGRYMSMSSSPATKKEPKHLKILYNQQDSQLIMIQEIIIEELKLLEMLCNPQDSQLVMIQEIIIEEPKLSEILCNQRDSQLVMIQEIITETPKAVRSKKDKLEILQLGVKEKIILEAES
jgi:hypothetical protein